MASAFVRTLRALELDTHRTAFVLGAITFPLFGGWIAWAALARAPVYAVTATARTEIEGSVIPVDVPQAGRVMTSRLALGRHVEAGEVLFELDSALEKARLEELRVRKTSTEKRLEPLRRHKDALLAMLEGQKRLGGATLTAAAVRATAARNEAERRQELADISKRLAAEGVGSKIEMLQANQAAARQTDTAREGAAEMSRTAATQALELQRLGLQDIELARSLADSEAELAQIDAQIRTSETEIERRIVRALVAGYLGDVAPVTVGMNVSPGKPVAMIIPDGSTRMVAYFLPTEAVGRVKVGQRAFVRFNGFPWTQFGIAEGDVTSVGVEPRAGANGETGVRVEIAFDRRTTARIPLQHGMPASVQVRVDEATPWQMLMRTLGGVAENPPTAEDRRAGSPK